MEWHLNFTIDSGELFEMIERIRGEPLTENNKSYIVGFMNRAFADIATHGHPTRIAMLAQTAAILAEQIKSGVPLAPRPGLLDQFPKLAPDDGEPSPA